MVEHRIGNAEVVVRFHVLAPVSEQGWLSGDSSSFVNCRETLGGSSPPLCSNFMRERIVERKFSGWSLNIPKGLRLTVRDVRTGEVMEFSSNDLYYWMKASFTSITSQLSERG